MKKPYFKNPSYFQFCIYKVRHDLVHSNVPKEPCVELVLIDRQDFIQKFALIL